LRGRRRFTIKIEANAFILYATFFNAGSYMQKILTVGKEIACWGKLEVFRGRMSFMHPEWELITEEGPQHSGRIVPIYKITEGMRAAFLTVKTLREKIEQCLINYERRITDYVPPKTLKPGSCWGIQEALHKIHFPQTLEETEEARRRMAFDELILFSVLTEEKKLAIRRIEKVFRIAINPTLQKELEQLVKALPFELTGDQQRAIAALFKNSAAPYPVNHLLMGDVGSGKTLVALMLALVYMRHKLQVAYLAPTEILARQHYQTFLNILPNGSFEGVELLLGKDPAKERRAKLDRLSRGESLLAIGTHALIQDEVNFDNLSLIIIDEQHRFGRRAAREVASKGQNARPAVDDCDADSAHAHPGLLRRSRTGLSQRKAQEPHQNRHAHFLPKAISNEFTKRCASMSTKAGRHTSSIPVIDESENSDMASLVSEYATLESEVFPDLRLGLLHGRLSGDEKDRAMQKFKEGLIQVLVATTVVEVGIDVPNASVIVIRNPDRFGLSQLHQLRGRVGRGLHQSFCILVAPPTD
jgi:ATP-dependent DNA helicase RecG